MFKPLIKGKENVKDAIARLGKDNDGNAKSGILVQIRDAIRENTIQRKALRDSQYV